MNRLSGIEAWVGRVLPTAYRNFLAAQVDDLTVGEGVLLYGQESFIERNETYETKTYCPGFVTLGDDGGGRQLLLSLAEGRVLLVGSGDMTPDAATEVAGDFAGWLASGCPLPE